MTHSLSNTFLRLAVFAAIIGMIWGNVMGFTHNHLTTSAHAHLNLLGWVSMSIYGLVYRVLPMAAEGPLPKVHLWLTVLSLVIMVPNLAFVLSAYQPALSFAPHLLGLSGVLALLAMMIFGVIVFRHTRTSAMPARTRRRPDSTGRTAKGRRRRPVSRRPFLVSA